MTMPEFPETSGIPDDSRHWDALTERAVASARDSESGLYWLATARGAWIASTLLVAVGLIASLSPISQPSDVNSFGQLKTNVAPDDTVGEAIVLGDKPPDIGTLLLPDPARSPK